MRILITGARGMVGSAVTEELTKDHEVFIPKKYEMNVGNFEQVMSYEKKDLDYIIHLSGETDHEYCDLNPANCYYINTIGTANMTELAKKCNIPIIYMSTASVFDGDKLEPYSEYDEPNPINHYNKSKYYGELMVKSYKKHFIIRAGWMFGGGENVDKKFVYKIIKKIRSGHTVIKVCNDCIGSPTYNKDVAKDIRFLIEAPECDFGIYHSVNEGGGVNRYDFAKEIVKIMGLDNVVDIEPCRIDDLKDEFPCKRTNYEVLKNCFIKQTWQEALKGYIHDYFRY